VPLVIQGRGQRGRTGRRALRRAHEERPDRQLTYVKDGIATFTITGTTEGIENGPRSAFDDQRRGKVPLQSSRVIEIVWKQADERNRAR